MKCRVYSRVTEAGRRKHFEWPAIQIDLEKISTMSIDRIVMAFAGIVVLASLILSQYHSVNWLFLTGFVGLNLFQASFTRFCPLAVILKKLGRRPGVAFE